MHAWTVNESKWVAPLVDAGVENIITDDPAAMRARLDEIRRLNTAERVLLRVREALRRDQIGMPAPGSFAHAMCNPPFFDEGKSTASPHLLKSQAHAFGPDDLDLWAKLLHAMLQPRGSVTVVHRADSLGQLLESMQNRFGDIRIAPLFPRRGTPASRILLQAIKGSKAPLQIMPGIVLHDEGNGFTPEADAVLRNGAAFPLR